MIFVKQTVSARLKELRNSAVPKLSLRRMGEELGVGHMTYAYFEDPKRFKKNALPIDFTRKVAEVLARYGVDPAEVMPLAGLSQQEAEPEAKVIETARPAIQYVTMSVAMPSEAALKEMFRTLLVLVPEGATRDEAAAILARRLPAGFAAIGPLAHDLGVDRETEGATNPQSPAKVHREAEQPSHSR
jgi:hypothetical protein